MKLHSYLNGAFLMFACLAFLSCSNDDFETSVSESQSVLKSSYSSYDFDFAYDATTGVFKDLYNLVYFPNSSCSNTSAIYDSSLGRYYTLSSNGSGFFVWNKVLDEETTEDQFSDIQFVLDLDLYVSSSFSEFSFLNFEDDSGNICELCFGYNSSRQQYYISYMGLQDDYEYDTKYYYFDGNDVQSPYGRVLDITLTQTSSADNLTISGLGSFTIDMPTYINPFYMEINGSGMTYRLYEFSLNLY